MISPYYDKDGIVIYHCDCREILPEIESVGLVLTDPPYGIGEARNKRGGKQYGLAVLPSVDYGIECWDDEIIDKHTMQSVYTAGTWAIIFGGNYYELPPSRCWLVWDKENGTNCFADCELAWTNLKKSVRLKRHLWNGMLRKNNEYRNHPTQKPLDVIKWCIGQAPRDIRTILDPFMGSGTTLRAAKDLGLEAIGIEISEKYCEMAAKRLEQGVLEFS